MSAAQIHGFPYSSAPLKTVKYVQFGILSPEETVIKMCSSAGNNL